MPGIRKVFGPFKPTPTTQWDGQQQRRLIIALDFHFFGIREDHSVARWVLRYTNKTRQFRAHAEHIGDVGGPRTVRLQIDVAKLPVDAGMFLGGEILPVETGLITDILRKRLKPEHIAMCTALTINGGRT